MLTEYDDSNNLQRKFIYGNYIDEVLLMIADGNDYYYAHDHLYSPAALIDSSGTVIERYEYDAYGNCWFREPNFALQAIQKSKYENNYLFTGRRVDILDNSSLKIQYNRNRYYDYYTGRWLTHDPLGYVDGMNLYEYGKSNPVVLTDPVGGCSGKLKDKIGKDEWSRVPCSKDDFLGYHVYKWRMVGHEVNPKTANLFDDILLCGTVIKTVGDATQRGDPRFLEEAAKAAPYCRVVGDKKYQCDVNWHAYVREYECRCNPGGKEEPCCRTWHKYKEGYKKCEAYSQIDIEMNKQFPPPGGGDPEDGLEPGVFWRNTGLDECKKWLSDEEYASYAWKQLGCSCGAGCQWCTSSSR